MYHIVEKLDSWRFGATVGMVVSWLLEKVSLLPACVKILPFIILLDTISGMRASQVEKKFNLSTFSGKLLNKLISYTVFVALAGALGYVFGGIEYWTQLAGGVIFFKEAVSITENLLRIGVLKEEDVKIIKDFLRKRK